MKGAMKQHNRLMEACPEIAKPGHLSTETLYWVKRQEPETIQKLRGGESPVSHLFVKKGKTKPPLRPRDEQRESVGRTMFNSDWSG